MLFCVCGCRMCGFVRMTCADMCAGIVSAIGGIAISSNRCIVSFLCRFRMRVLQVTASLPRFVGQVPVSLPCCVVLVAAAALFCRGDPGRHHEGNEEAKFATVTKASVLHRCHNRHGRAVLHP